MDGARFDRLVRQLLGGGSPRRGLLRRLSAIPLAGALASLLGAEGSEAKKRGRKRRGDKRLDDERKNKHKKRKKKCKSKAKVCKAKCGAVHYTCHKHKKKANCGPCACNPPCGECLICNASTGTCEPDPSQQGDECGQPGQVCQANGDCACDATSCPSCADCQNTGLCSEPCGGQGCCDDGACADGDDESACGTNGEACSVCSGDTPFCDGGECVGCSASDPCPGGQVCCGGDCVTGNCCDNSDCANSTPLCVGNVCTTCDTAEQCQDAGLGDLCCGGACVSGVCCDADNCAPGGNACISNECQCGDGEACSDDNAPDCCGDPGTCTDIDTDPTNCGSCGGVPCPADTPRCWDGICVCGDVCASGCQFSQVQDAINAANAGAEIIVCAGTFSGPLTIAKSLTIHGAGQGTAPTTSTILQGTPTASVIAVSNGEVAFQNLRLTDGHAPGNGGGINRTGATALILSNCTITGNAAAGQGGGLFTDGDLTMNGCLVEQNQADDRGGGLAHFFGMASIEGTGITDNNAGLGGAIYVSQSTMNVSGGNITANTSTLDGGGIFNGGGEVTLTSCDVVENTAGQNGGGIFNNSGNLELDDTEVEGNNAGSGFTGGGIFNNGSTAVSTCTNGSQVHDNTPDQCASAEGGDCRDCG